jgi:hypothetical protein
MRQIKPVYAIPFVIIFIIAVFFFTKQIANDNGNTPNYPSSTQQAREKRNEKVPTTPKKGAKGTAKKSDVPTTSGITPNYTMELGKQTKQITVGKNVTIISVPKGHTVAKYPGILVGFQGTVNGRAMISLQTRSGTITFTPTVI